MQEESRLPEPNFKYNNNDLYTTMYKQYYFKDTPVRKLKPVKRKAVKKKSPLGSIVLFFIAFLMLFYILPYSFKTFIGSILPPTKKVLVNVDYNKLMYPTSVYLNQDLFLGKFVIKEHHYKKPLMVDIKESTERTQLKNRLIALAKKYNRIIPSVYVWEYSGKSYVNINADVAYPAASIIKVPVLIEMFREIESGKFKLNDTMILEDYYRASGSGKLQYTSSGVAHTMDYLARIMIQNSDNSSTNMIMSKIGGMPEMNRALKRWGLKTTRINAWLPDLQGTNITTAREMAKMLYNIDNTNILSNTSKVRISDYLSHVKNNRLLQAGLPREAILLHKTGDIGFMLGDAGIVKTANGKKYIVVILVKRPYNNLQGKEFIVEASKLIYNNMSY